MCTTEFEEDLGILEGPQFRAFVRQVEQRHTVAANVFVEKFAPQMRRAAQRRLTRTMRRAFSPSDIVQSVFCRFFRASVPSRDFQNSAQLGAYLIKATVNRIIDLARSLRGQKTETLDTVNGTRDVPHESKTVSSHAGLIERIALMRDNAAPLTVAIVDQVAAGKDDCAIARELGIHRNTVRRHRNRARAALERSDQG